MNRFTIAAVLLVIGHSANGRASNCDHIPRPADYPAKAIAKRKPAAVRLDSQRARRFRTVLRAGSREGPNFAGHYTVVVWGCGLDSFELAVVDAVDGRVYFPPFGCITLAGGFGLPPPEGTEPVPNPAYRLDSKVLVTIGVDDSEDAEDSDRTAKFWAFENGRFRLVCSVPAASPTD
jgi:hypothetical protein